MSGELTKAQELSKEITEADTELSDQDLEDVAGGTAISSVNSVANAGFGGIAISEVTSIAIDINVGRGFHSHRGGSHHHQSC